MSLNSTIIILLPCKVRRSNKNTPNIENKQCCQFSHYEILIERRNMSLPAEEFPNSQDEQDDTHSKLVKCSVKARRNIFHSISQVSATPGELGTYVQTYAHTETVSRLIYYLTITKSSQFNSQQTHVSERERPSLFGPPDL